MRRKPTPLKKPQCLKALLRASVSGLLLLACPEARAQDSCAGLSAAESRLTVEALGLVVGKPAATAITFTCGAGARSQANSAQLMTFMTCAVGACALTSSFWSCSSAAADWFRQATKRDEIAARKRLLGCG